ncbi:hypothetical protein GL325_04680 [Aeromicrobium sp. 636]|uniref:Uncharacterized protein n=1 Tax=Aeromicrobium senzhongii TaxID=2663859 RepID=A0A8I0EUK0_9ACTN|nr:MULTISPECIES: hypothetical protein [Aeromicrobium]MBC9225611.1 hypothetical protein [Aeromicrobium senzhongii]MCQ3997720.1 hypothetical protein [Aeromicrobium sp. 636]
MTFAETPRSLESGATMGFMFRRNLALVALLGAALFGGLVTAPVASAAPAVSIKKISNKKVAYGARATIKPSVRAARTTKVVSKRLTVKVGKKTIAKNRASVRLKSGKYKVTTTVRFRIRKDRTTQSKVAKNVLTVPAYHDTPVTCVANNVRGEFGPLTYDLACTGALFDGTHTFYDVTDDGSGTIWAWDSRGSYISGPATMASEGARFSLTLSPGYDLYQLRMVTVKKTVTTWSGMKTTKKSQSLTVKQRPRPNRADPDAWGECPSWAPIKGNGDSMIYHVPGGRYYEATIAEECFRTEGAARAAGYRASRNG